MAKIKGIRTKPCGRCERTNEVRCRVRVDEGSNWIVVVPTCLDKVKPSDPHDQYGGTWKSKKHH